MKFSTLKFATVSSLLFLAVLIGVTGIVPVRADAATSAVIAASNASGTPSVSTLPPVTLSTISTDTLVADLAIDTSELDPLDATATASSSLSLIASSSDATTSGSTTLSFASSTSTATTTPVTASTTPTQYALSAVNNISTLVGVFEVVSPKLESRISGAAAAGFATSTMDASLSDLNAHIADASTSAALAQSEITAILAATSSPQSTKTGHDPLVAVRSNIKTATADLTIAQQDAVSIITVFESFNIDATTTATSTVTITPTSAATTTSQ